MALVSEVRKARTGCADGPTDRRTSYQLLNLGSLVDRNWEDRRKEEGEDRRTRRRKNNTRLMTSEESSKGIASRYRR